MYTHSMTYDCLSPYAKSRIGKSSTAKLCASPTDYDGGSAAVFYNSTSFYDDLLWAAAWLYQATGTPVYNMKCFSIDLRHRCDEFNTEL